MLTTSDVSERLGVSVTTVYKFVRAGHLKAVKILGQGPSLWFREEDVERFEQNREVAR